MLTGSIYQVGDNHQTCANGTQSSPMFHPNMNHQTFANGAQSSPVFHPNMNHQTSANGTQSSPMFHSNMKHREQHALAGAHDQPVYLGHGRFGDSCQHLNGHIKTFHMPSSIISPSRLGDLPGLHGGFPVSPPDNYTPLVNCTALRQPVDVSTFIAPLQQTANVSFVTASGRQPINVSNLKCPIMFINKPKNIQTDSNPSAVASQCPNNPGSWAEHTKITAATDRDMQYLQEHPSVGQYHPTVPSDRAMQYQQEHPSVGQYHPTVPSDRAMQYQQEHPSVGQYHPTVPSDRAMQYQQEHPSVGQYHPTVPSDRAMQYRQEHSSVAQYHPTVPSDRAMQYQQEHPSVGQYHPTGGGGVNGTGCTVECQNQPRGGGGVNGTGCTVECQSQPTFNINNGQYGYRLTAVNDRYFNEGVDSRHSERCTDHMPHLQANTNSHFPAPSFKQRHYSTEAESIQYNLGQHPFNNIILSDQHPESHTHPHRQHSLVNGLSFLNNFKCDLNQSSHGRPQNSRPHLPNHGGQFAGFSGASLSEACQYGRSHNTPYQRPAPERCCSFNIQQEVKDQIRTSLQPGHVLQVCGPPMAGKSTVVRQAIREAVSQSPQLIQHHIDCKTVSSFQSFLSKLATKICPQHTFGPEPDEDSVIAIIDSLLPQNYPCCWVLVFHKCENLRDAPERNQFVKFLERVARDLMFPVIVVFTTYKFYLLPKNDCYKLITVGMLSLFDIMQLVHGYAPHVDYVSYAHVLEKTFCFPEAVRLIVEEFIADDKCRVTPEVLEKKINRDHHFMAQLFESHLQQVSSWVPRDVLLYLIHFGHSVENSFTEAHLEYVNSSDMDQADVNRIISYLKNNHVVRVLPTINRMVIHPLVVYYYTTTFNREKQLLPEKWFDNTCNRHTHFVGRVLMSAEATLQEHGRKGLVVGGLFEEWPKVRYVIQMALHCNQNTYKNFIKIGVSASGFILKFFPREAESFYWSLYKSAQDFGTDRDLAVMEAMLGQSVSEGSGKEWSRAEGYLTSAIERLSTYRNSFYLGWAVIRKAIILHRQGKYEESLEFCEQGRNVLRNVDRFAMGEEFSVSEARIEEEMITQEIHETIPYIFTGHNQRARQMLDHLLAIIENSCENHPELATLLNLVGLTEQRGNKDLAGALRWYKLSYSERMYFAKMCPEKLLAVLNNIGMILFQQGNIEECTKYLHKALDIQRESGWTHYYTGLTLLHLAEIHMKIGNLAEAFKRALEAERIFTATVKDHDVRLRINFVLAHLRIALRQALNDREHSMENSQDIVSMTISNIEPCDLQKSAEDYLRALSTIAASMEGTLSDDGFSLLLSSLEHLMLLSMGNPAKFEEHKTAFLKFTRENSWLEENGATNGVGLDSRFRCLMKHKGVYLYLMNTPYVDINVDTFIQLIQNACTTCLYAPNVFNTDLWVKEVRHCKERRKISDGLRQLDLMRVIPERDNSRPNAARNRAVFKLKDEISSGVETFIPEMAGEDESSTPRNMNRGRDSVLDADPTATGRRMSSESGLSKYNEVMRGLIFENRSSVSQLQDGDRCRHIPHPADVHTKQDPQLSDDSPLLSPVSPRIANIQKDILDKILSCKYTCPLSKTVSFDVENHLASAADDCGKTFSGTNMKAHTGLPAPREPVEQSYTGDEDPSWNNDDSFVSLRERQLQERCDVEMSVLDELQQQGCLSSVGGFMVGLRRDAQPSRNHVKNTGIGTDAQPSRNHVKNTGIGTYGKHPGHSSIRPICVGDLVLQDDLSKPKLVHECKPVSPDAPSCGNHPVYHHSTSESQTDSSQADTYLTNAEDKFSVIEYLIRNGFSRNLARTGVSETQTNASHLDKSTHNFINCIQELDQTSSGGHQLESVKEETACGSSKATNVGGSLVLAARTTCTQSQLPGQKMFESRSELVKNAQKPPTPQQNKSAEDSEDIDSGRHSLQKRLSNSTNRGSCRLSGSESSNVFQRSRGQSESSCSGRNGQVVGAMPLLPLESGYLSQHTTGAGSRSCSVTERPLENFTTVLSPCTNPNTPHCTNPNTATPYCTNPNTATPYCTNPNTATPYCTNPNTATPYCTNPNTATPYCTNPNTATPYCTNPNTATPYCTNPNTATPYCTNPNTATPYCTNPNTATPYCTNPNTATPYCTNPNTATPYCTNPNTATP